MSEITSNEMLFVLTIFKSPEIQFNANSIAKLIGVSSMGALKIAKKLEKENILLPKRLGKAVFYRLNFNNEYALQYLKFLLKREVEQADSYVKFWVNEIKKIKSADCAILFGSVLRKQKEAKDIDVLFITNKKKFSLLKKEIEEINMLNVKKIHPLYQTKGDLINNIKKNDKVILNAIKGLIVFGEDLLMSVIAK